MTIDYLNYQTVSVSPKTQISYMEEHQSCIQKPKMKLNNNVKTTKELVEQLHNYKFPLTRSVNRTSTTCSTTAPESLHQLSTTHYNHNRRNSSISSTFTFKSNNTNTPTRRVSHRRSAAVSGASSNESIFSSDFNPSSPSTRVTTTRTSTGYVPSLQTSENLSTLPTTPVTPTSKTTFDNIDNHLHHGEYLQAPKKPQLLPTEVPITPTNYPLIDLDVVDKPLVPRLGSPMPLKVDATPMKHGLVDVLDKEKEDEEEEDQGEGTISIVDFLRESISERAMSVSADYDPFQYIHITKGMWIDEDGQVGLL
ncbi:unnamed protein product [Wickerhamomyces anomalus]